MAPIGTRDRRWSNALTSWFQPKAIVLLFLGFSAGLPFFLIFATLSVWLREADVARSSVTFFSWAGLGFSFKFLWAPLVDLLPLPVLTRLLGRRRSWLLLSQLLIIASLCLMATVDPAQGNKALTIMAFAAVLLGFSAATQDIVIDAYRIECADSSLQALLASMYITGYRIGMLVSGAGALLLAATLGTSSEAYSYRAWEYTYFAMALVMGVGILTTLTIKEPASGKDSVYRYSSREYLRFLVLFLVSVICFAGVFFFSGPLWQLVVQLFAAWGDVDGGLLRFIIEVLRFFVALGCAACMAVLLVGLGLIDKEMASKTYIAPIREFFSRYRVRAAVMLLLLVGFYRVSDIVLGVVSNVFYLDLGFSKEAIAGVTKGFGLAMTLVGGFAGGLLTLRHGVYKILFLGALLSAVTNLLFMLLAGRGADLAMLTLVIGADNFSAGIATTAFVAFLSSLTSISFTAVQYAIFSSVMTLFPKLIGGYSGTMVSTMGYERFFLVTALMGLPVLLLIYLVKKQDSKAVDTAS